MGTVNQTDQTSIKDIQKDVGWPFLCFGSKANPLEDRKTYGVPFLPSYYSYLIKISSSVGVVEIYPWLAELMFHSAAVDYDDLVALMKPANASGSTVAGDGKTNIIRHPLNVVSLTIDESMDTIADVAVPRDTVYEYERGNTKRSDQTANYLKHTITTDLYDNILNPKPLPSNKKRGSSKHLLRLSSPMPRLFQIDTMGVFGDILQERPSWMVDSEFKTPLYCRSSVVGSGNPMRLLQRFVATGAITNDRENRLSLDNGQPMGPPGRDEGAPEDTLGLLNCFIINSIGNLSRRMGFRDTMHLIRAMMERGVWQLGEAGSGSDNENTGRSASSLFDRPGMMFALVTEDVFTKEELRYAETFFDGVIRFYVPDKEKDIPGDSRRRGRPVCYRFERFPLLESELRLSRGKPDSGKYRTEDLVSAFAPDYANQYHYLPVAGTRLDPSNEDIGSGS